LKTLLRIGWPVFTILLVALLLTLRAWAEGWIFIVMRIPHIVQASFHAVIHIAFIRAVIRKDRPIAPVLRMAGLSSVAFTASILLQFDLGDGNGWLVITALVDGDPGLKQHAFVEAISRISLLWDPALLIPHLMTLFVMLRTMASWSDRAPLDPRWK
jgi:hypothetical protein